MVNAEAERFNSGQPARGIIQGPEKTGALFRAVVPEDDRSGNELHIEVTQS
mgnify:CR=1 FL=1